ncbi:MAG: glutaredoxin family protein [Candidatus Geothermincolales bacterium]
MWKDYLEKVDGEKKDKDLLLFALSTCGWCRRAREFLDGNGLSYEFVYVDLLEGKARDEVMEEVARWNPRKSFPTLVVDGEKVLAGFNEERYRELLLG